MYLASCLQVLPWCGRQLVALVCIAYRRSPCGPPTLPLRAVRAWKNQPPELLARRRTHDGGLGSAMHQGLGTPSRRWAGCHLVHGGAGVRTKPILVVPVRARLLDRSRLSGRRWWEQRERRPCRAVSRSTQARWPGAVSDAVVRSVRRHHRHRRTAPRTTVPRPWPDFQLPEPVEESTWRRPTTTLRLYEVVRSLGVPLGRSPLRRAAGFPAVRDPGQPQLQVSPAHPAGPEGPAPDTVRARAVPALLPRALHRQPALPVRQVVAAQGAPPCLTSARSQPRLRPGWPTQRHHAIVRPGSYRLLWFSDRWC